MGWNKANRASQMEGIECRSLTISQLNSKKDSNMLVQHHVSKVDSTTLPHVGVCNNGTAGSELVDSYFHPYKESRKYETQKIPSAHYVEMSMMLRDKIK